MVRGNVFGIAAAVAALVGVCQLASAETAAPIRDLVLIGEREAPPSVEDAEVSLIRASFVESRSHRVRVHRTFSALPCHKSKKSQTTGVSSPADGNTSDECEMPTPIVMIRGN